MDQPNKGPFRLFEQDSESSEDPFRNYDCDNYQNCLSLAAGLDWDGFKCDGCQGQIQESLYWQVRQAQKKDQLVKEICDIPIVECIETPEVEAVSEHPSVTHSIVNQK